MRFPAAAAVTVLLGFTLAPAFAADTSAPAADPVLETPTLHCLGAYWVVRGDDNRNARVDVGYRKAGADAWRHGPPLFRVERGKHKDEKYGSRVDLPDGAWLFAGSVFFLDPGTDYEMKLTLADPDGGAAEKVLRTATIAEPRVAADAPCRHVVPDPDGKGGGTGAEADPFRGLAAAHAAAKPGNVFLLRSGVYEGTFTPSRSGEPGRPIVWRASGGGEVVLQLPEKKKDTRVVGASGVHDVWFEGLTLRNATYGIVAHDAARLVVRRCRITDVDYGLTATRNDKANVAGFFVSDNVIEGPSTWPRTKGIESARGVQLTGTGHVVCFNRIRGFADAVNTFPSAVCAAIDFHNNEIFECTDDGIELDFSQRNNRAYHNRLTNVFQGISVQPVHGGPVYAVRNAVYNVAMEPFKIHNSPSGALFVHNTVVKAGPPLFVSTPEPFSNCVTRNNLFVGTAAPYAMDISPKADGCDFDYDGFAGGPFNNFLKWNGVRYPNLDQVKAKSPVERHATKLDAATAFASGVLPPADPKKQAAVDTNDLRLKPGTHALDAGQPLPGLNDGHAGAAPDLGAYELGAPLPHYGPRSAKD